MDSQEHETQPSLSLPTPQGEFTGGEAGAPREAAPRTGIEQANGQQAAAPQNDAAGTAMMAAPTMQPAAAQTSGQAISTNLPQIADDTDLIEKEWVVKAKEIVAATAQDPYRQNKEMTKVKADYLKKRYNKDLKLIND